MAATIPTGAAHHIALTVSDPVRSRAFYELLGFQVIVEFPVGVLMSNGGLLLGLRTAPDPSLAPRDDRFSPNRVGLDHLALGVGGRSELEAAARLCSERGVMCGEVTDLGESFGLLVLMLKDPDGIQIELSAPRG